MTEPVQDMAPRPPRPAPDGEPRFELDYGLEQDVNDALAAEHDERVHELVRPLHYADLADLLERLSPQRREALIRIIRDDFDPDMLAELDEWVRDEVLDILSPQEVAEAVSEMDTDDAVYVVGELDAAEQKEVLEAMPPEERTLVEEALAYPEESAGRLMQRQVVTAPTFWSVGETIDHLRTLADEDEDALPSDFYDIYVVDPLHRPVGAIRLSRLLRTRRAVPVTEIMDTELNLISDSMDQEDVAFLFRQRDLTSAPVVTERGRLVGVITIDDVVDVIDEEHEEDIMRLGGVSEDDFYGAIIDTTKARFWWLAVNLLTAILASVVIGLFEATIDHLVALAVLMPIVASMGGNAGTQTLTVAVRALATKELTPTNALRVIGKELMVGSLNGVMFAVLAFVVAWLWFGSPALGLVIAVAMIANLVVAGLAGTTIPLALERFGVDPAIASTVFLTTVTDVVGFFAFLGLAAAFLM